MSQEARTSPWSAGLVHRRRIVLDPGTTWVWAYIRSNRIHLGHQTGQLTRDHAPDNAVVDVCVGSRCRRRVKLAKPAQRLAKDRELRFDGYPQQLGSQIVVE